MFDIWLSQRMQFNDKDRREAIEVAGTMLELLLVAKKNGILSTESRIESCNEMLLKIGLTMAVDMVDPVQIREILQNYIMAGDYRSGELLKRIIILEGVVGLAAGENPHSLYGRFASRFGEDFFLEYERYCKPVLNL